MRSCFGQSPGDRLKLSLSPGGWLASIARPLFSARLSLAISCVCFYFPFPFLLILRFFALVPFPCAFVLWPTPGLACVHRSAFVFGTPFPCNFLCLPLLSPPLSAYIKVFCSSSLSLCVRALANPPGTDLNKVCPRGIGLRPSLGLCFRHAFPLQFPVSAFTFPSPFCLY